MMRTLTAAGWMRRGFGALLIAIIVGPVTEASAQVIGTFRWQLAPSCNVVTLTVEQRDSGFLLTGFDDQCGAPVRAAATGTAHLNQDGTAGIGFTVLRPDGRSIPTTVILNLVTISGTWTDAYSNSGTFTFNPPSPAAGSPRTITLRGNYGLNFMADAAGHNGLSPFSFGETLAVAPTAIAANFIQEGGAPTANCPGSAANPQAAPGHLCVYEQLGSNVAADRCVVRMGGNFNCNTADRHGAAVFVESVAAGNMASQGSWAVTIP